MTTEEQKRKKRKKILKILAALMGVFLLIGCCSISGLIFLGRDEPVGEPVPSVAAAATYAWPQPEIAGPTSTATPIIPTSTPQPTARVYDPSPVLTLTPIPTDGVDAKYISGSIALLGRYGEAMTGISEWSASFGSYDTFADWAAEASPKLVELLVVGEGIRELQPSPRFAESHRVLCEATEHYDAAAWLIAEGLDTLDADRIAEAVVEMNLGTNLLAEAEELLPD